MISGDPKRADIIIAGGIVLHEVMSAIGLDYLFVSRRGLRDGLMVDLLQRSYRGLAARGIRTPTAPSRSNKFARNTLTTSATRAR